MSINWNMKSLMWMAILFLFIVNLRAGGKYYELAYVETKIIHGFSIGVTDDYGRTNTPPDRHLCFTVWTTNKVWFTNNIDTAVFPTQPEYAYQVDLFDTNGVAIPKTEMGEKVGSRFLDFDSTPSKKGIKTQLTLPGRRGQPPELHEIFRPSDLFNINKPGKYTLRIRFQILAFPRTGPNRGDHTTELIRFPSLDYPLVQSDAAPKK